MKRTALLAGIALALLSGAVPVAVAHGVYSCHAATATMGAWSGTYALNGRCVLSAENGVPTGYQGWSFTGSGSWTSSSLCGVDGTFSGSFLTQPAFNGGENLEFDASFVLAGGAGEMTVSNASLVGGPSGGSGAGTVAVTAINPCETPGYWPLALSFTVTI